MYAAYVVCVVSAAFSPRDAACVFFPGCAAYVACVACVAYIEDLCSLGMFSYDYCGFGGLTD